MRVRRSYYLLQMPGWGRRLHVVADWTTALLFRPDIVKIDLASEAAWLVRDAAAGAGPEAGVGATAAVMRAPVREPPSSGPL